MSEPVPTQTQAGGSHSDAERSMVRRLHASTRPGGMTKERVYELYCGNGFTVGMATVARRGAAGRMYRRLVDKHLLDEHTGCLTMLGKELVFDAA